MGVSYIYKLSFQYFNTVIHCEGQTVIHFIEELMEFAIAVQYPIRSQSAIHPKSRHIEKWGEEQKSSPCLCHIPVGSSHPQEVDMGENEIICFPDWLIWGHFMRHYIDIHRKGRKLFNSCIMSPESLEGAFSAIGPVKKSTHFDKFALKETRYNWSP